MRDRAKRKFWAYCGVPGCLALPWIFADGKAWCAVPGHAPVRQRWAAQDIRLFVRGELLVKKRGILPRKPMAKRCGPCFICGQPVSGPRWRYCQECGPVVAQAQRFVFRVLEARQDAAELKRRRAERRQAKMARQAQLPADPPGRPRQEPLFYCVTHRAAAERRAPGRLQWTEAGPGRCCVEPGCYRRADAMGHLRAKGAA